MVVRKIVFNEAFRTPKKRLRCVAAMREAIVFELLVEF